MFSAVCPIAYNARDAIQEANAPIAHVRNPPRTFPAMIVVTPVIIDAIMPMMQEMLANVFTLLPTLLYPLQQAYAPKPSARPQDWYVKRMLQEQYL